MLDEIRNMAGEVVAELPDTPGDAVANQIVAEAERETLHGPLLGAVQDLVRVLAAAEHLADVAEHRSPTEKLTEALGRYREAMERYQNPPRDLRPGSDAFETYYEHMRRVIRRMGGMFS